MKVISVKSSPKKKKKKQERRRTKSQNIINIQISTGIQFYFYGSDFSVYSIRSCIRNCEYLINFQ